MTALALAAQALQPGFRCTALLGRRTHAAIVAPWCTAIHPAPTLRRVAKSAPDAARLRPFASWLGARGFRDPETLERRFRWWQEAFWTLRPALVVADFAPTALMAARSLGVPAVALGPAFALPSEHAPATTDPDDPHDRATCALINRTLGPLGAPPIDRLEAVFDCARRYPRGLHIWDPFHPRPRWPVISPLASLPPRAGPSRATIFAYLSTVELREPAILEAFARVDRPTRLVAPGITPETRARLATNPALALEPAPLSYAEIAASAQVIVCAGQSGMSTLAVLAGIPMLALPQHLEQANNASGAARLPSVRALDKPARSADAILAGIEALWSDPDAQTAARAAADALRPHYAEGARDIFRRELPGLAARAAPGPSRAPLPLPPMPR
ncbi:MAG: hypothetical protein JJU42_16530 [Rhodobacteraceae bacterium]|nr:hypothetical protein [Paracoccaceae bacterium]